MEKRIILSLVACILIASLFMFTEAYENPKRLDDIEIAYIEIKDGNGYSSSGFICKARFEDDTERYGLYELEGERGVYKLEKYNGFDGKVWISCYSKDNKHYTSKIIERWEECGLADREGGGKILLC